MQLDTTPLHPRFGVEITNVDLRDIDAHNFGAIRAAFDTHSALLFREQEIDDATHIRLACLFGPLEDRNAETLTGGADFKVPEVSNITEDGTTTGEMDLHTLNLKSNMLWHSDSTFLPVPALSNMLVARVVTETGGQTELASTRAGWADMPEALKSRIRGRGIWHRYAHSRAKISKELAKLPMFHKWDDQCWKSVWTNPANGQEALYIASHAFAVEGMDAEEALELIDSLMNWVTQPEYVYSHTWNVGDVLVWDQRAVLHRATPWNYAEPRKLSSICSSATDADGLNDQRCVV